MRAAALSLIVSLIIGGCSFGDKEKSSAVYQEEPKKTFITYEVSSIDERKGPCTNDSIKTACLDVVINYPVLVDGPVKGVLDTVNNHIVDDIFNYAFVNEKPQSFEELISDISIAYDEVLQGFPDYSSPWSLEISSDIIFQSSTYISVATSIFSYTGGAHPNSYLVYKSYNLETGHPITLDDILVEDYEKPLNRAAEIEFRMNYEIPPSKKLSESGFFFEEDEFRLNGNFAIIDKSLVFYFNPYEIASYAQGPSELELKLTDYIDLIKSTGVLGALKD